MIDYKILIYKSISLNHKTLAFDAHKPISDIHIFDSIPEAKEYWRNIYLGCLSSGWSDQGDELSEGSWINQYFHGNDGIYHWVKFPKTQKEIRDDKIIEVIDD